MTCDVVGVQTGEGSSGQFCSPDGPVQVSDCAARCARGVIFGVARGCFFAHKVMWCCECSYYKRIYQHLFVLPEKQARGGNGLCLGGGGDAATPVHMRFGWMLFLALRTHVLNHFADLVTCTNGLLAVIVREPSRVAQTRCNALLCRGV